MGDSIATNLFMVGYAYQRGLLPISEAAIMRAIELNGAAVESNKQSFRWGRLAAVDPGARVGGGDSVGGSRIAANVRIDRRDGRAPAQIPDRLPGCRLSLRDTRTMSTKVRVAESTKVPGAPR